MVQQGVGGGGRGRIIDYLVRISNGHTSNYVGVANIIKLYFYAVKSI